MKGRRAVAVLALTGLLASGCSTFVDRDQLSFRQDEALDLTNEQSVGQTFVARHGGLEAVDVYLSPSRDEPAEIVLHLRSSSLSITDILTTGLEVAPASQPGFHQFAFPPIQQSHGQYYYAVLEQRGANVATVPTGVLDSYADGTAYADGVPQSSQLAFRLVYDPASIVLDLLGMVLGWAGYGSLGIAILFLCGYGLIRGWATRNQTDFTADLIVGSIAALSAWMVLLVWLSVARVRLSALSVRVLVGVAASVGLFLFFRDGTRWRGRRTYWLGDKPWATLALWAAVTLSIGLRLFVGRGLVMLPGSDTYHHTLIAQLFEEQGGIPRNYEPYAPLVSFSYHFGFHSIVALFRLLLGTELLLTTKNVALVLNGAIAATVGLLAERMAGSRRAGFIAATIVGLVAVSPFCLLRWGRFTQTTGLLFLALGLFVQSFPTRRGLPVVLPLIVVGALSSHYRIAFFWILFSTVLAAMKASRRDRCQVKGWLLAGLVAAILSAPWLARVAWTQYDPHSWRVSYPVLVGASDVQRLEQPVLAFVTNKVLVVGSLVVVLAEWLGRTMKTFGRALVVWCVVLAGGALALKLGNAVSSLWDLNTVLLSLPVPVAALSGSAIETLWRTPRSRWRRVVGGGMALLFGVGGLLGLVHLPSVVYTGLFYLRPGDHVVMEWIENNTPTDALFVAGGVEFDWLPGWVVGTDAGYWIPLLGHRVAAPLAMIYPLEWGPAVNPSPALEALLELMKPDEDAVQRIGAVLARHGVTHVFSAAQRRPLTREELSGQVDLRVVFRQDRTTVFEVKE